MKETTTITNTSHREIDHLKIVRIVLSRWYLLMGTILLALFIAHLYLWYTPKIYATNGVLKFEEKKTQLYELANIMGNSGRPTANIQSEKIILQSRNLLLNAIKRLNYDISFYISGRACDYDLYPEKPFQIIYSKSGKLTFFKRPIQLKPLNQQTFKLSWETAGIQKQKIVRYNSPVNIGDISFIIKTNHQARTNVTYLFKFNSPETLLERISEGLFINEALKNGNIINLQQTDSNPRFAADVLNAIMLEYLAYDRNQKTQSATQMIRFINAQQAYLAATVKDSESALEKHQQNSGIMNIDATANIALSKISELESRSSLMNLQLLGIDQLKKQIMANKGSINLNFNLEGNIDPLLGTLIVSLNGLLKEKSTLLKTYNPNSSTIEDLDLQIAQIKTAALRNTEASSQRIIKSISYINQQIIKTERHTALLPAAEKNRISLRRDFEINEKVYSFLTEKKLEAQINRAAILPGATIIEYAEINEVPVSPDPGKTYRMAIVLGLLAGLAIIVLIRILNPFIYDKDWVESVTDIPIAGIIKKYPHKIEEDSTQILSLAKPRSIFAESLRAVRTNLSFLASEKKCKVICITSEIAGEGKSFIALNLAGTLALIDKKVIVICADLRRPKLQKAFQGTSSKGLSNYLAAQCSADEIIQHTPYKKLDFISAGPLPPNPAELLLNKRFEELISELKRNYEIIMIDTAPVGLVSDAIPLICKSDINIFIIRHGKSRHSAAMVPQGLANKYGLKNVIIILNAFTETHLQSGYYKNGTNLGSGHYYADYNEQEHSGYYGNEEKSKWWKIGK